MSRRARGFWQLLRPCQSDDPYTTLGLYVVGLAYQDARHGSAEAARFFFGSEFRLYAGLLELSPDTVFRLRNAVWDAVLMAGDDEPAIRLNEQEQYEWLPA